MAILEAALGVAQTGLAGLASRSAQKRQRKAEKKMRELARAEERRERGVALTELTQAGSDVRRAAERAGLQARESLAGRGIGASSIAGDVAADIDFERRHRLAAIQRRRADIMAGGAARERLFRLQRNLEKSTRKLERLNLFLQPASVLGAGLAEEAFGD